MCRTRSEGEEREGCAMMDLKHLTSKTAHADKTLLKKKKKTSFHGFPA